MDHTIHVDLTTMNGRLPDYRLLVVIKAFMKVKSSRRDVVFSRGIFLHLFAFNVHTVWVPYYMVPHKKAMYVSDHCVSFSSLELISIYIFFQVLWQMHSIPYD